MCDGWVRAYAGVSVWVSVCVCLVVVDLASSQIHHRTKEQNTIPEEGKPKATRDLRLET